MTVSTNKYVACTYDLYAGKDDQRELMEQASEERPMEYIHGLGMMLPAFEKNLMGLKVGDKFDFVIPSADAYGDHQEENVIELPKEIFKDEEGNFDNSVVFEGNLVPMRDNEGHVHQGAVLEITDEAVLMDFNHPLAGEDLHFEGQILEVRDADEKDTARFFNSDAGCGSGCSCASDDSDKSGCGSEGGCCGGGCH